MDVFLSVFVFYLLDPLIFVHVLDNWFYYLLCLPVYFVLSNAMAYTVIPTTAAIFQYGIEKIYWQYIVIAEGFYILKPTKYRVSKL